MNNFQSNYEVFPCVVRAGSTETIHVRPLGEHARFDNILPYRKWDEKRRADKNGVYTDIIDRNVSINVRIIPVEATENMLPGDDRTYYCKPQLCEADGSIVFSYEFKKEQEYVIQLKNEERNKTVEFSVYAVGDDLYGKKAFRGCLHLHSYYSDGSESPVNAAASYLKHGYDFMALTDHFKAFSSADLCEKMKEADFGLTTIPGEEAHEPDNKDMHTVNIGTYFSYNLYYQTHREECNAEVERIADTIEGDYPRYVKISIATRIFCSGIIRKNGGLPILVHPYWRYSSAYNVRTDVLDYVYSRDIYDAYEVIGGVSPEDNNMQALLYYEKRAQGIDMPVVGSDDCHKTEPPYNFFGQGQTIAVAAGRTSEDILDAVRSYRTAAVQKFSSDSNPTVVGHLRLGKYVSFLLKYYFPHHDELCFQLGMLQKAWANGDSAAYDTARPLLAGLEEYGDRFFGIKKQ